MLGTKLRNLFDFSNSITKNAVKVTKLYNVAKEFQFLILLLYALKLIICAVSVFSGYSFFKVNLSTFFDSMIFTLIVSITILIVIEYLTNISLSKLFKFAFKSMFKNALSMLFLTLIFFSISFIISTKGISYYMQNTTNENILIESKYNALKDSINIVIDKQIDTYNANLAIITAPAWNKNQYTTTQQNTITSIYNNIQNLETRRKSEFKELDTAKQNELNILNVNANLDATKYYKIVAFIMIFQLLTSALICFFNSRIFNETEKQTAINEQINIFSKQIVNDASTLISNQIALQYNSYLNALAVATIKNNDIIDSKAENGKNNGDDLTTKTKSFEVETPHQSALTDKSKPIIKGFASNDNRLNETNLDGVKTCPVCGVKFIANHKKQIYCSEKCRCQNYANVHGKKCVFGGVTYEPQNN